MIFLPTSYVSLFQDLTFSLRDHFVFESGRRLEILGVDLDRDLVDCAKQKLHKQARIFYRRCFLTFSANVMLFNVRSSFGDDLKLPLAID